MSSSHSKAGAVGILGLQAGEDVNLKGKQKLSPAAPQRVLLGFHTDLGLALWGSAESVFSRLDEPVALCLTSPPYAIQRQRAYGGPDAAHYVDWMCSILDPIVRHLVPGGAAGQAPAHALAPRGAHRSHRRHVARAEQACSALVAI